MSDIRFRDCRTALLACLLACGACSEKPGVQLCQAIATRDLGAVQRVLARHEFEMTIDQGGCVPAAAAFTAPPGDVLLTAIGVELIKAGMPPTASWESAQADRWETAVEAAARNGNAELVRSLFAVGLDATGRDAARALIEASAGGHLQVVKLLIDVGLDPEVVEGDDTPLDSADANGHEEVVLFLQTAIADRASVSQ